MGKQSDKRNKPQTMLSTHTQTLIAIGAAVSLNCKSCLETLVPGALQQGILPEEIEEAVSVVAGVRGNVSASTDDLVAKLLGGKPPEAQAQACCGPGEKCSPKSSGGSAAKLTRNNR